MPDELQQEAQDQTPIPSGQDDVSSADQDSESPPSPSDREADLLRRLRAQGNELAETRRSLGALQASLQTVQSQQDADRQTREQQAARASQAQEAEWERWVQGLEQTDPGRAALERSKRAEQLAQWAARMQQSPARQQPVQQQQNPYAGLTADQYEQARVRDLLAIASQRTGAAVSVDDLPAKIWDSDEGRPKVDEERFYAAALLAAADKLEGNNTVATKPSANGKSKPSTREEIEAEVLAKVRKELGLSGPTSARPVGGATMDDGTPDYNRTLKANAGKPGALRKALEAQREAAAGR